MQTADDRIAELEETIRQMREAFAPALSPPYEWKLMPAQREVLQLLMARPSVSIEMFAQYVERRGRDRDHAENLKSIICGLRRRLEQHGFADVVRTQWGIGYCILDDDKVLLRAAMRATGDGHAGGYRNDTAARAVGL